MQMSALLTKMALFVVVIAIGMFGSKKKILGPEFSKGLSWLLVNIFIVAAIINSVITMDASSLTLRELGLIMLISALCFVLMYALSALIVRLLPVENEKKPQLEMLMASVNNLFVTLPVVETVYGSKGAFIIAIGCIPFNLLLFSYGTARLRGKGTKFRIKDVLSAPLLATVAGLLIFMLDVPVPDALRSIISSIGAATVPLSMLLVGASLGRVSVKDALRDKSMYMLAAARFLVIPAIVWFVMRFVSSDPMIVDSMVITAASPSAIIVTALSLQAGRSGEYSSEGILVTTLLSMLTLPLTVYLLQLS